MDSSETIIESVQGTIKVVTYNKPKRKNAIDFDMYKRVTRILNDGANDSNVSMMVFTGAGDYFSSGNDLVALRTAHTPSFLTVLHDFIEAFITFPKLLVAVVNGPAVGIAVTTLPLCDLVFAAENAFFYTPFGKLGITAEGCSTFTFPRIIGYGKALEMLVFNQKMNAKEALNYGLVNCVYKPEEVQTKVWNKLVEMSNVSNDLLTTTKRLMRSSIQDKLLKVNDEEIRLLNEAWSSRESSENNSDTVKSKI
ncbi:enoyl-CoA delta isomerase 2 [Leguminivora glycinivorella]|uniref:enoyl-CoA delta isomerase 2 n=1 Tax=Leguminivora glycinivorella TaxID=1035111 RepID=UPI00200D5D5B|nr:enoyl-CoA delta isomerase 2 [Leguminivora glycinivorella]